MATMFGGQPGVSAARDAGRTDDGVRHPGPLGDLIQCEIIPRLLNAHSASPQAAPSPGPPQLTSAEVESFAPLPLSLDADELLGRVENFLARGVSAESIFVDLLAPSARKLGQFWEDDVCDFVDVTMGLWRLQEVMREVAMRVPAVTRPLCEPRSALFTPMPGEQHSFGTLMVEEIFARAGWTTEALIEPRRQDLLRTIAGRDFDLVGLTVSNDCLSGALSDLITAIRSVSKNPAVQVFIGGRVVNANPAMMFEVGADGTAPDAATALALAERKVSGSRLFDLAVL